MLVDHVRRDQRGAVFVEAGVHEDANHHLSEGRLLCDPGCPVGGDPGTFEYRRMLGGVVRDAYGGGDQEATVLLRDPVRRISTPLMFMPSQCVPVARRV